MYTGSCRDHKVQDGCVNIPFRVLASSLSTTANMIVIADDCSRRACPAGLWTTTRDSATILTRDSALQVLPAQRRREFHHRHGPSCRWWLWCPRYGLHLCLCHTPPARPAGAVLLDCMLPLLLLLFLFLVVVVDWFAPPAFSKRTRGLHVRSLINGSAGASSGPEGLGKTSSFAGTD